MFIRLTKKDGTFVWLNTEYIVTVEPVRTGGTIVVPVGDGLDYEVRESAETIISLVEGTPVEEIAATVAETPEEAPAEATPDPEAAPAEAPVFEQTEVEVKSEAESAAAVAAVIQLTPPEAPAGGKPAKRARKTKGRPVPAGTPATEGERKVVRHRAARKTPLELTEDQLSRIRAMAPRSVKRLSNTLSSQFDVIEPETVIRSLVEHDIITVDEQSHITWIK